MGIQFETDYNMETLTAMAKGLRKTVRKKRSRRVHIFAAVVLILGLLTILATTAGGEPLGASGVVLLALLVVILVSLFEDRLNAWFARKRLLPGTEHAAATFAEEGYVSATGVTESRFSYAQIVAVAETARYFVFALSSHHTQAYDKRTIRGGSVEDFRAFIAEKTGKLVEKIK